MQHLVEIGEVVHEKNKMSNTNNTDNDGQIVLLLKCAKKLSFYLKINMMHVFVNLYNVVCTGKSLTNMKTILFICWLEVVPSFEEM